MANYTGSGSVRTWYKDADPQITMCHSSELPYAYDSDRLIICDENSFHEFQQPGANTSKVRISKDTIRRAGAGTWSSAKWPLIIPADDILSVSNSAGHKADTDDEHVSILVMKASYLRSLDQDEIDELVDTCQTYDQCFVTYSKPSSHDNLRIIGDVVGEDNWIQRGRSWHLPLLSLTDRFCLVASRDSGWSRILPEMTLDVREFENSSESDDISSALADLGMLDKVEVVTS